jgi:Uma2 family endonuclease
MSATLEISEKLYTVEEWLELEKRSDVRHEYYYGKLIPMPGEAKRANIIAGNIRLKIDEPLYKKGIQIYDHDVKAEVVPKGIYRYPDLVAAPVSDDEDDFIIKQPVLLVEVASEGSRNRDQVKKRIEYLEVPTLIYYLIVSQNEMWAELHLKNDDGRWETQYFTEPAEVIEMKRFELKILMSDIYKRIKTEP